jgi:hypothetical protein
VVAAGQLRGRVDERAADAAYQLLGRGRGGDPLCDEPVVLFGEDEVLLRGEVPRYTVMGETPAASATSVTGVAS